MKLLLDTHAFLWHADGNPQMSATATALVINPENELFLSMASVWEIAIKAGMKKLTISAPFATFMTRMGVQEQLHSMYSFMQSNGASKSGAM